MSLAAITAGVVISFVVAPPALALASAAAFAISELSDFAVYTPLVRRGFALAVVLSCVAGAAIDSAAFLWLAFGSLQHVAGRGGVPLNVVGIELNGADRPEAIGASG